MKFSISINLERKINDRLFPGESVWYARIDKWTWGSGKTPQDAIENLKQVCKDNFDLDIEA